MIYKLEEYVNDKGFTVVKVTPTDGSSEHYCVKQDVSLGGMKDTITITVKDAKSIEEVFEKCPQLIENELASIREQVKQMALSKKLIVPNSQKKNDNLKLHL